MRYLLYSLLFFVAFVAFGCARVDGTKFVSFTTIGIEAGLPEGVTLVIGYRRAEIVQCETEASVDISLEGKATATGLDGKQHARFGKGCK